MWRTADVIQQYSLSSYLENSDRQSTELNWTLGWILQDVLQDFLLTTAKFQVCLIQEKQWNGAISLLD